MKTIYISGRFYEQRITGVQRYAREIVSHLDDVINDSDIETVLLIRNRAEIEQGIPSFQNIKVIEIGGMKGVLWDLTTFSNYARKNKGVAVNLCNCTPLVKKSIVTIHDVAFKANPEYCLDLDKKIWHCFNYYMAAKITSSILTVSEFSKKEIVKYYNIPSQKIHVIGNGWNHMENVVSDELIFDKLGIDKNDKFFFAMSTMSPNKNIKWILNAALKNEKETFVIAGTGNINYIEDKERYDSLKNVIFAGYVSDGEAKSLMEHCTAFILPTFYEGFGIPPLEAIACGAKNIILSDTEVMHEIYRENAIYIDPWNIEDFNCFNELSDNNNFEELLDCYSWEKQAKKLLNLIKNT